MITDQALIALSTYHYLSNTFVHSGLKMTISYNKKLLQICKKLGFYGEILLNKMLRNWQILLNKVLGWLFNQEWPPICADTVLKNI